MKYSIYNTILHLNDKYIIVYNAFSDKYTVIKHSENIFLGNFPPVQLKQSHSDIYHNLVRASAIIKDKEDQTQAILSNYQTIVNSNENYSLKINPTLDCNFKCWYCYEDHQKSSRMTDETILTVKKYISSIISSNKNLKNFSISFFGGEPLLKYNPVVKPILEHFTAICKEHNIQTRIGFTSNGYLLNNSTTMSLKEFDVNSFQITLDGDREHHNRTRFIKATLLGSYDRILSNIKALLEAEIKVVLRINFTADAGISYSFLRNEMLTVAFNVMDLFNSKQSNYNYIYDGVNSFSNNVSNSQQYKLSLLFKLSGGRDISDRERRGGVNDASRFKKD